MEFFDSTLFDVILTLVVLGLGLKQVGEWLLKKKADVIASKLEAFLERTADILEGGAEVARGAGFEKIADAVDEFADVPDQAGDVFGKIADMVSNEDFTKESLRELVKEVGEVGIEGKDFWVKIIKKPEDPIV